MLHDGDATEYFVVELKEILLHKYSQNKSILFIEQVLFHLGLMLKERVSCQLFCYLTKLSE